MTGKACGRFLEASRAPSGQKHGAVSFGGETAAGAPCSAGFARRFAAAYCALTCRAARRGALGDRITNHPRACRALLDAEKIRGARERQITVTSPRTLHFREGNRTGTGSELEIGAFRFAIRRGTDGDSPNRARTTRLGRVGAGALFTLVGK
jgi:hypothetical protein